MTIEETLEKVINESYKERYGENRRSDSFTVVTVAQSEKAMGIFAKQQSIEFFKWSEGKVAGYAKICEKTVEELYDLFIQSNKQ